MKSKILPFRYLPQLSFSNLLFFVVLPCKGLDHAHPGQVLLQGGGEHGFLCLILFIGLGHLS